MRSRLNYPTIPVPELFFTESPKRARRLITGPLGGDFEDSELDVVGARTWNLQYDDKGTVSVVCMPHCKGVGESVRMGLLAHEATHIADFALASIGEGSPASEERAYVTQAVMTNLCELRAKERKRAKGKKRAKSRDKATN